MSSQPLSKQFYWFFPNLRNNWLQTRFHAESKFSFFVWRKREFRHATLSCIFKGINLHFCLKKMIRTTCSNTHSVTAHTHLHWVRCSVNQNMILVGDRINAECFGTLQPFRPLRQTERFGHFSYINSINES